MSVDVRETPVTTPRPAKFGARTALLLALVTSVGIVAFFWPFLAQPGSSLLGHSQDAPWLFALLLPLLLALVLAEISDGVRSAAEANARTIIRGLVRQRLVPTPLWNVNLVGPDGVVVAKPDAWFDEVGLAWEIDSVEYHLSPVDYARTVARRWVLGT